MPAGWPQWRGVDRDAHVQWLPKSWSEPSKKWSYPLPNLGVGGVAATEDFVIVSSRDRSDEKDLFVCLDAETGLPVWNLEYAAAGNLDYGNSPRATPIITEEFAILQGAFGDLHCIEIETGKTLWKKNLIEDLHGELPIWGFCTSPIIVEDLLIVQPSSKESFLAALNIETGDAVWTTAGKKGAYSSPIAAEVPGKNGTRTTQIITFDENSLGGWDATNGHRLWTMTPKSSGDFNVPTPVAIDGGIVLVSENNSTRIHRFAADGTLQLEPSAECIDVNCDTHTPVRMGSYIAAIFGDLFLLDLNDSLKEKSHIEDAGFGNYASLIATEDRLLSLGDQGDIVLLAVENGKVKKLGGFKTQPDKAQILAHPALAGTLLFVRGPESLDAWDLGGDGG